MKQNPYGAKDRRRLTAFTMALILFLTVFAQFLANGVTYAKGTSVGASGTISAIGSKTNLAGGIYEMDYNIFRVGISRDPAFYHSSTPDVYTAKEAFSHRFPDQGDSSLYFKPKNYREFDSNYVIAKYSTSSRQIQEYNDAMSKSRLVNMNYSDGNKPGNGIKTALNGYKYSSSNANYSKLVNGKWKEVANKISVDDANRIWSYILHKTGSGYEVTERMNNMISPSAEKKLEDLTSDEKEDVYRGYLSLLMATWRVVPEGYKGDWERAIEDYLVMKGQTKGGTPATIVVDVATTVIFSATGKKMVIPAVDYFMYYTAIRTKWDLYNTKNLGDGAGDTYAMLKKIVDNSIIEDGKDVNRISDKFDKSNVFSWGASAIVYPYHRFSTSGNYSHWDDNKVKDAFIDSLTIGNSDGGGKLRGFVYTGYHLLMDPPLDNRDDAGASIVNADGRKDVALAPSKTTIGESAKLKVTHDGTDIAAVNSWINILDNDPYQTINVKITWDRKVEGAAAVKQATYDKGTGIGFKVDQWWFKRWILGQEQFDVQDTSLLSEPMKEGDTKKFIYTPTVVITYKNQGKDKQLTAKANPDYASYTRPPNPPQLIQYTSQPSAFAEFKNGEPDKEEYDAMSGVPSNKRLYLGVGGSEFIVDVELEYQKNVDSVWRTYRSYYTPVDSEFKAGDTAPPKQLGGQTVDLHRGGTYTKTWTGSIPNNGSPASGVGSATSVAVPDMSDYNAKKAEAQAYAAQVNATTLSHTAASDKKTRSQTGWSASITTDSPSPPQDVTQTASHTEGDPPVEVPDPVTANPSGPGSFTITVSYIVPSHIIDGPDCENVLPMIQDTWKQRINFDYMKISRVEVYKIDSGRVTSVDNVFGEGNSELKATIQRGDPNIFTNIAQKNANGDDVAAQSSAMGRIRYSLDGNQHDVVVYNEGPRSNKSDGMGKNGSSYAPQGGGHNNSWATGLLYTNGVYTEEKDIHKKSTGTKSDYSNQVDSKDQATAEWKKFDERRKALNKATIISDMLVLQTSAGDQSVLYFDKDSQEKQAQEQFPAVRATKEEMWDNNPNSAAKWVKNHIEVGSYNGNYAKTGDNASSNQKYWAYNQATKAFTGTNTTHLDTAFDSNGVGVRASVSRPARPDRLYIYGSNAIVPTTQNGAYKTGKADVFFERVLDYKTVTPYVDYPGTPLQPAAYKAVAQTNYGSRLGVVLDAPYSPTHSKVNDIVIHTPVSTEDAVVVSLPSERDQRTSIPADSAAALQKEQNSNKVVVVDDALIYQNCVSCVNSLLKVESQPIIPESETPDGTEWDFNYTGVTQDFVVPEDGIYTLEVWGAEGGTSGYGGKGGYSKGNITLTQGQTLKIVVGGTSGYNGGGSGHGRPEDSGGGGTDIRKSTALTDRVIVAGGGGGWGGRSTTTGGDGGGTQGSDGVSGFGTKGIGGSQTGGGAGGTNNGGSGSLGVGGSNTAGSNSSGGGGGGGYYGGGAGGNDYPSYNDMDDSGGGGGSGYTGGLSDASMQAGANRGNGKAKITAKTLAVPPPTQSEEITGVDGYTWEEILGPNWKNYLTFEEEETVINTGGSPVNFNYTGGVQEYKVPSTGTYKLEAWGAGGGGADPGGGGNGGYSSSEFKFNAGDTVQVVVGQGGAYNKGSGQISSYNGGGAGFQYGGSGGGATDFRSGGTSVTPRLAWDFSTGINGFRAGSTAVSWVNNELLGSISYFDGNIISPSFTLTGQASDYIEIVVKNNSGGPSGQIYFSVNNAAYSESAVSLFTMSTYDSDYQTYRVPVGQNSAWVGKAITSLRFDLANDVSSGNFQVKQIRIVGQTAGTSKILVAGGGGGGSDTITKAGSGGGLTGGSVQAGGGTQTSGGAGHNGGGSGSLGQGGSAGTANNSGGGGGGGYYGGGAGSGDGSSGGGGSSYVDPSGLNFSTLAGGGSAGGSSDTDGTHGKATITPQGSSVKSVKVTPNADLIIKDLDVFPKKMADGRYNPLFLCQQEMEKAKAASDSGNNSDPNNVSLPSGGSIKNATFINIDYGFQVYFPNIGDFAELPDLKGIDAITTTRGKGYKNDMNTTEWTEKKRIRFQYNVIYETTLYRAGSWINLPVDQSYYDFYAVLANSEAVASTIEYEAIPINARPIGDPENENYVTMTNKDRYQDYTALHGAYKKSYIDVVGRIGNFAVSDTEDFRFSNLFKVPLPGNNWVVEGLVKQVDSSKQNRYYGDVVDIRGTSIGSTGVGLNTYGTQKWLESTPLQLPINPKDNEHPALKEQFLKIGYDVLGDISTTGNYQEGLTRVLPYYYKVDLQDGSVMPLDAYIQDGENYKLVNKYKGADAGALPSNLYPFGLSMDWEKESERRNYTLDEAIITDRIAELHGEYTLGLVDTDGTMENGVTGVKRLTTPTGNYVDLGNAQRIVADKTARTFIGTSKTMGEEKNLGGAIPDSEWEYAAQRWHLKFGLPSSTVFVPSGKEPIKENFDTVRLGTGVILMTADIVALGDTFSLRWDQPGTTSFKVTKDKVTNTYSLSGSNLPPVIALYDLETTAKIDVTVKGSH